uniref:Mobile element protein n=1 Tax=Ralstonia solanacearum TaxID=305 RepID=A0A0S4W9U5_RALSL
MSLRQKRPKRNKSARLAVMSENIRYGALSMSAGEQLAN